MADAAFDLDAFFGLPRLQDMHLSPDGQRLALTIASVAPDGKRMVPAIWEVDPGGGGAPRRLTRSAKGETARGYLPDGSLLFTSSRADVEATDPGARESEALYLLPARGGEPRRVAAPDGGVLDVLTARASQRVVLSAPLHPGCAGLEEDAAREKARRDAGVQARLHEHYPVRFWDHPIGPRQPRLLALDLDDPAGEIPEPRDLTPEPPWAGWLEDVAMALRPDGGMVALGARTRPGPDFQAHLAVIPADEAGAMRLLDDGEDDHALVAWSPDGSRIAVVRQEHARPDRAPHAHLELIDPGTGARRALTPGWEAHCHELAWIPDGSGLLVTVDEGGHVPVVKVGLDGSRTRLTASGAHAQLRPAPDSRTAYAVRSSFVDVPQPVTIDLAVADQPARVIPSPVHAPSLPVRLDTVTSTTADGTSVQSWLLLPGSGGGPHPLALFVHGGPISAWGAWTWRWCAALLAARGWAVLAPNPRLSTGFGYEHIASTWGNWADLPAGDILGAVDATVARPDIDGERAAALGGSYGGYMVNWLATQTDRFRAIVTHAGVWDLFIERAVSDAGYFLDQEFGDPLQDAERWRRQSPHLFVDAWRTPTLIIHGERDDRVPVAQALALWTELRIRGITARMLIFPDENHWILKPQNSRLWYETVIAFLDEQVLGTPFARPALL